MRAPHNQDQHSSRLDDVTEVGGQTSSISLTHKMVTFVDVYIRCMFSLHTLIGYLATGGRSPTLRKPCSLSYQSCYKDDVTLYHCTKLPHPHFQVSGRPLSSEERNLPVVASPSLWWTSTGQSSLEGTNLTVLWSMKSTCLTLGQW